MEPETHNPPPALEPLPHWENKASGFSLLSFFITTQEILFSPRETFRRLHRGTELHPALIFGVSGGTLGALTGALWQSLVTRMMGWGDVSSLWYAALGTLQTYVAALFLVPLIIAVGLFLMAALFHLSLKVAGGAGGPYAVTFKILAYAQGATALLGIVPVLGTIAAFFWSLYIVLKGFRSAHGATAGQSFMALALPFFALMILAVVTVVLVMMMGWAALRGL